MTLSKNPTLTKTIEKRYIADIRRRFSKLRRDILARLKFENLILNAFEMDASRQRVFIAWLELEIERLFFSTSWQEQYLLESYNRALKRVRADLIREGENVAITESERTIALTSDFDFSAQASLISQGTPTQPIHQDELEFVYTRSLDSLKTATAKMSNKIRLHLFDGVKQGKGIIEIRRDIVRDTGIAQRDAERIARTEIIQAHHRANANEAERLSEINDEEYKLVWITGRDERVRPLHANWHGSVNTTAQVRDKISQSPWNCRCTQRIITDDMITETRLNKWAAERIAVKLLAHN